ncbi:MAG TPA: ABC transporter permease [Vicinamibacterales bacterium]|nr:ABC transporter permease [Vicinamibacterales bacterium]
MAILSRFRSLWRNLMHRGRVDDDLDAELRGTFDAIAEEHRRSGLNPDEARRAATIQFGHVESLKEQVRDVKAGAFVETWIQDVRYAVRLLRRSRLFAIFAIGSLALGIGATGAIFMLFDSIVLRTLPVPEADRLVVASFGGPEGRFNYSLPYPHFEAIRDRATSFDGVFALTPAGRVTVTAGGDAQAANRAYVTGDYYKTLRLAPALGRLLTREDDRPGQATAVLSHAYWQRRFGGRPDVVGTTILLNRVPFTIVGVEPAGFSGTEVGRPYDISVPMRSIELLNEGKPLWNEAFATWIYIMARLKPGVTVSAAEREASPVFMQAGLDAAHTASEIRLAREWRLRLESGARGNNSDLRDGYERWLRLLLMMLGAVLLLASLNVATLLLSRSDARQREIATRLALGAARGRIVRQLLSESLVLATAAGTLGLGVAVWGSRAMLRIATPTAERPPVSLATDWRLIVFLLAVSVATCLLFGLIPAIRATSPRRLAGNRQVGGGRQRRLMDRTLVASQVALSLVLLVTAGLFLRTLGKLWTQDTGYDRRNVLLFSIDPRLAGKRGDQVPGTYRRVLDELRAVHGAQAVTMSAVAPVSDSYYFVTSFRDIGGRHLPDTQRGIRAAFNHVAPEYFATLGIPLIAGRDFDEHDTLDAPKVAIISERMARHFEGNPIGQRIGKEPGASEVVGVVKDVRYANVKDAEREVVYFPIFQVKPKDIFYAATFEIRYAGGDAGLLPSIRDVVARADSGLTMFRVKTLERQTEDSFARERLLALMTSYFGGFAVLLACIGLYGLLSYGVTQRTAELGLRMALGAQPSAVRWLVVRESAWTVIAGIAAGLGATVWVARLLQAQLFGVQPYDPAALLAATALLLALAVTAAYLPARRASHIDPLTALRHE